MIQKGIWDENRVVERLMQYINYMTEGKFKGILLSIFCWFLHLDFDTILKVLGYI